MNGVPQPLTAGVVFAGSLVLLLVRPRYVPDWAAALSGGLLMVAVGVWSPLQAARQLADSTDVLLFFVGLGLASATADRAGLFHAASHLAGVEVTLVEREQSFERVFRGEELMPSGVVAHGS